ncbi:hypothetical protein Cyrtocomes_00228 [Candidatus Cyrtobacter comes]|uniref:Outer membrane protein beta-barrel domain-containing protein n=1 Tax=Candidatus Cyrtobacter comes TaxID=675776 RepID=A0ABU5L6X0_9RICK|nr:hypothetical protein [Candidatus Cyrtobacter comes]MDZ5761868.1 hypothetical protein [Candidatus Cyrtobacter comes]
MRKILIKGAGILCSILYSTVANSSVLKNLYFNSSIGILNANSTDKSFEANALVSSVGISYELTQNINLQAYGKVFSKISSNHKITNNTSYKQELSLYSINIGLSYKIPISSTVNPYIGIGIGSSFANTQATLYGISDTSSYKLSGESYCKNISYSCSLGLLFTCNSKLSLRHC